MSGLAEAVGIIVARAEGIPLGLSGGVPAQAVVGALAILAAAFLSHLDLADGGARLLADLGRAAAREGTQ